MISDERHHGESAELAGGAPLPTPVRKAMAALSQVMKKSTYHI